MIRAPCPHACPSHLKNGAASSSRATINKMREAHAINAEAGKYPHV